MHAKWELLLNQRPHVLKIKSNNIPYDNISLESQVQVQVIMAKSVKHRVTALLDYIKMSVLLGYINFNVFRS